MALTNQRCLSVDFPVWYQPLQNLEPIRGILKGSNNGATDGNYRLHHARSHQALGQGFWIYRTG
jgi:hypothetical protein